MYILCNLVLEKKRLFLLHYPGLGTTELVVLLVGRLGDNTKSWKISIVSKNKKTKQKKQTKKKRNQDTPNISYIFFIALFK